MIRAVQADPKTSIASEAKSCFLVPELCHLVGMTDQMRNRRHTWREIKQVIRVDAPVKIQRMQALVQKLLANEKSGEVLSKWGLALSSTP